MLTLYISTWVHSSLDFQYPGTSIMFHTEFFLCKLRCICLGSLGNKYESSNSSIIQAVSGPAVIHLLSLICSSVRPTPPPSPFNGSFNHSWDWSRPIDKIFHPILLIVNKPWLGLWYILGLVLWAPPHFPKPRNQCFGLRRNLKVWSTNGS